MKAIDKLKLWIATTGLKNIGYIGLFIIAIFFQMKIIAGIFLGIFIYINYNVIQKLVRNAFNKIDR